MIKPTTNNRQAIMLSIINRFGGTLTFLLTVVLAFFFAWASTAAGDKAKIITDSDTGCQYITSRGGVAARLDKNGYPMGCANR